MNVGFLQTRLATLALFFLPLTALNLGISLTVGDMFFIPAVLLNLKRVGHFPKGVVFFLAAIPLILLSTARDPDADWVSIGQTIYIFCFVLPLGWCAFVDLTPTRIANTLVIAGIVSSVFAAGQFIGVVPRLPSQQMVEYFGGRMVRVAGLVIAVNDLAQSLAPLPLLLTFFRPAFLRSAAAMLIVVGLCCTVSKQAGFGFIALVWYVCREKLVRQLSFAAPIVLVILAGCFWYSENIIDSALQFLATVEYRISYSDAATGDRLALINAGFQAIDECMVLGYGVSGAIEQMRHHHLSESVHVYFIGAAMIGGVPAATLLTSGFLLTIWELYRRGQGVWAVYLIIAFLILQCHTVTMMSSQSVPLIVAVAILVRSTMKSQVRIKRCAHITGKPHFADLQTANLGVRRTAVTAKQR